MDRSSIFDLLPDIHLSDSFLWEPYTNVDSPDPFDILVHGELQEILPDGTMERANYYEATYEGLIKFSV